MTNKNKRQPILLFQVFQKLHDLFLYGYIQSTGCLITDQNFWFYCQGSCDRSPLALSATYLIRISFCIFLLKTTLLKQFCYSLLHISLFHSTVSKALTDSVTQCPSGIKRTHRILKNHLYISIYLFQLTLFQSCNIFSFKFQCTLCDVSQPGDQLCYGTFPAAGFSYDSQRFSSFQCKAYIIYCFKRIFSSLGKCFC